jgi:uncharacterized membrane protein
MVEQQYLLFLGSALIMLGLVMLMFSIKPKRNGSTGIILLGPIPIVWGGRSKLMLLIPLLFLALTVALVFLL